MFGVSQLYQLDEIVFLHLQAALILILNAVKDHQRVYKASIIFENLVFLIQVLKGLFLRGYFWLLNELDYVFYIFKFFHNFIVEVFVISLDNPQFLIWAVGLFVFEQQIWKVDLFCDVIFIVDIGHFGDWNAPRSEFKLWLLSKCHWGNSWYLPLYRTHSVSQTFHELLLHLFIIIEFLAECLFLPLGFILSLSLTF